MSIRYLRQILKYTELFGRHTEPRLMQEVSVLAPNTPVSSHRESCMADSPLPISLELAREIARQGEVRLEAILSLTAIAVARATTLCGIFGGGSIALGAAVLTYLSTGHPSARLIAGGTAASLLLLAASVLAALAGASRSILITGGLPEELRAWSWKGNQWCSEAELLDAFGQRLSNAIERNMWLLARESRLVNWSLRAALTAIAVGLLMYAVAPLF